MLSETLPFSVGCFMHTSYLSFFLQITPAKKNLHGRRPWQIWGMVLWCFCLWNVTPSLVLQICVFMILGFLWCLKLFLDLYVLSQISQEWRRQWHDLLRLDLACFCKTLLFHTPAEILCAVLKFVWHVGCWRFYNIHHISSFFLVFFVSKISCD